MKDSKILVTGANGFIGQALCQKLAADGWPVAGAVRNESAAGKLRGAVEPAIVGAVGPETDWVPALAGVDSIVHLAARVHAVQDRAADKIAVYRTVNVAGTQRLAEMAASRGVRRFIYLSSVKVVGEGKSSPYTEDDRPMPSGCYAISKQEAELDLLNINYKTGLEVVVLRPPLVYGPQVKANFLQFLKVVDKGLPLPFENVKNRRSLIYLGNLIEAILTCIQHPRAAGNTYFVSDGQDTSTPELIKKTAALLGKPSRMFPFPLPLLRLLSKLGGKFETMNKLIESLTMDISKIRTELDWKPPYSMAEGLIDTAQWYRQYRQALWGIRGSKTCNPTKLR